MVIGCRITQLHIVARRAGQTFLDTPDDAHPLTGIPPAGTGGDSEVERAVIRYADMEALYTRKRAALLEEQEAIELAIEPLPSPERQILRAHYIEGLTWEQVCVTVGYSWRQTHRHHARAIRQLEAAERENMA